MKQFKTKKHFSKKVISFLLLTLTIVNVFCFGFASFIFSGESVVQTDQIIIANGGMVNTENISTTTPNFVVGQAHFKPETLHITFDSTFSIEQPIAFKISVKQKQNSQTATPKHPDFDITKYVYRFGLAATRSQLAKPEQLKYTYINAAKDNLNGGVYANFMTDKAPFNASKMDGLTYNIDLLIEFKYTGNDFGNDVYFPMFDDKPILVLEIM